MHVYQCKMCFRIISNELCVIQEHANGIVVEGIEDYIDVIPTSDPKVYNLKCLCNNTVGEGHEDKKKKLTYKLKNDTINRFTIKKMVGHVGNDSEECKAGFKNPTITDIILDSNKQLKALAAKVEQLEKDLTSIKEEKYSEKLESLSVLVGENLATSARVAEVCCELNPDVDMKSVFPHLF